MFQTRILKRRRGDTQASRLLKRASGSNAKNFEAHVREEPLHGGVSVSPAEHATIEVMTHHVPSSHASTCWTCG